MSPRRPAKDEDVAGVGLLFKHCLDLDRVSGLGADNEFYFAC